MTLFELVEREVSAREAAELYGLKFDKNGRGFCPWHDDGRHAALKFLDSGKCYCHACHHIGNAMDITAQLLGISTREAAERIRKDFHLNQPVDKRPDPSIQIERKRREDEKQQRDERWSRLCEVVREADERLATYTPETADAGFWTLLDARCKANHSLDLMWEEMMNERVGRVHGKRVRQGEDRAGGQ